MTRALRVTAGLGMAAVAWAALHDILRAEPDDRLEWTALVVITLVTVGWLAPRPRRRTRTRTR